MEPRSLYRGFRAAIAAAMLVGCASNPQTPDEFRKTVPGSMMGKLVTFDAARPYREVARTFQSRAPECLNVRVRQYHQTGTASWMTNAVYKPTVLVTGTRAELHLQMHYDGQMVIGEEPPGGFYVFIADATSIGAGRTHVDIYASGAAQESLTKAVTGWATGKNLGCPDLDKG